MGIDSNKIMVEWLFLNFITMRKIIATCALFYANGPIHLGHLVEAIQTDIWARFQRLRGNTCYFISGSDTHGTPIMLKAEENHEAPEIMVQRIGQEQLHTFKRFLIHFDSFEPSNTEANQALVYQIYAQLQEQHAIVTAEIKQCFDQAKNMFLPDRFVKGTCPRCKASEQNGDSCEKCGATYSPTELIQPISVLSQTTPILKKSEHYFFTLSRYEQFLRTWTAEHLQNEMHNKLQEWFDEGLSDWDISRDAPYFGFLIPGTQDKYFYVWLDAPIGYLSSFKALCTKENLNFDEYWQHNSATELLHFIGKDIMYFHAMFWPALLHVSGLRTPTAIHCHGFLTINGEKMSKSRGTFISGDQYLAQDLNPEYLRYYFAAKLNAGVEDLDLNFADFIQRVNSDLVGKFVNIASRSASFINKKFSGQLANTLMDQKLWQSFVDKAETIATDFEQLNYAKAMREIMSLADNANQFVDQQQPWTLAKDPTRLAEVQLICTQALNLFKILLIYLKPVLPELAQKAEIFLNVAPLTWQDLFQPLLAQQIQEFVPLMARVDAERVQAL
jgi:methionyl-tRNA synthetase